MANFNTYSLLETERLLARGQAAQGKDAREAQMILNHKAAIELLVGHAAEIGFNRYTVCNLHALLAENLLTDPQAGGRLRAIAVNIGGIVFHPLEGPQRLEECFDQILATATAIADPFERRSSRWCICLTAVTPALPRAPCGTSTSSA